MLKAIHHLCVQQEFPSFRSRECLEVTAISLKAQQLPSFVPAQTLVDAIQKGLEVSDFEVKNYLEGQLLLQKLRSFHI